MLLSGFERERNCLILWLFVWQRALTVALILWGWNHSKTKGLLTPGVLLNKVGVSTSTKSTKEKNKKVSETVEFSHASAMRTRILLLVSVLLVQCLHGFPPCPLSPLKSTDRQVTLNGDSTGAMCSEVWMWRSVCDGSVMQYMVNQRVGTEGRSESGSPYRAHYRGILSSSSPVEISVWGSSASERTSSPGSDTASAKTPISVRQKHNHSGLIPILLPAWTLRVLVVTRTVMVHMSVAWGTYFDKVFNFKRQLSACIENLHTLSQDFYFSCWHPLLVWTQQNEKMVHSK